MLTLPLPAQEKGSLWLLPFPGGCGRAPLSGNQWSTVLGLPQVLVIKPSSPHTAREDAPFRLENSTVTEPPAVLEMHTLLSGMAISLGGYGALEMEHENLNFKLYVILMN